MRPLHPNLRIALAAKDSPVRPLCEAQAEQRSDVLRTRADLQSADTFTARSADFTAANSLTAAAATVEAVLASAPAANSLYEPHFKVTITPIVPGAGTNTHTVVVAVETDPLATGVWTEQWSFTYEVIRKTGEPATAVVWPSERMPVRVTGIAAGGKLRLKIKTATGPGGWSFAVHGFNLATDLDLLSGVTYHTGPAIDFLDSGGATLADVVTSKISLGTSDGYELDLGGPALSPDVAPFMVARTVWGKDDSNDIAVDRFTAQLHPKQNGANPKDVVWFICQPYALAGVNEVGVDLVPLCDPVRVPAGDGTTVQDYVFSFYDRTVQTPGGTIVTLLRKPRPKSVRPARIVHTDGTNVGTDLSEYDVSPTTFWFIWATTADGTPATNVGWARDSTVAEVVNGSRKMRAVQIRAIAGDLLNPAMRWYAEKPTGGFDATRPCFRCKVECGSYVAANLEFTGANLVDLGAAPTETVEFVALAGGPDGTGSVFEVRDNADASWLPFTDGQTAAEVGVSQRQTYKVRWRASPNAQGDASPQLWEIGVRDVKKVWLSDLIQTIRCTWSIPDVAELVPNIPGAEIVLIKNGEQDFNDRVTKLLSTNTLGSLAFRVWVGDPARPRSEWLHKDDFALIDDYDPQAANVTILAHSPLIFVNGALPVYNTTTQKREPLQLANKTPKQAYSEIVNTQLAPDIPGRFRGDGLLDESCLISQTVQDSDGLTELNAIHHVAGQVLSTAAGKLKSFQMFGPGAVQVLFPSEKITWGSTAPGLRQRVPRFFAKYGYDATTGEYSGEVRLISGNDILNTNLKAARVDARPELRDDVCRWIPTEELARRVGKRRVDTLGAGMLVWRFRSSERHPELEFGDVVAVQTDRFFARDPSQVSQRTLKGALWALGRIVEHDLEGRELAVWIQSYTDIFGGSDVAARLGFKAPDISSLALSVSATQQVTLTVGAVGSASVRYATSTSAYPSKTTTEAGTLVVLDAVGNAVVDLGALATLATMYVSVIPFENADSSGSEGMLRQVQITAQPIPPTVKVIFLTSGTSWTVPGDFNAANNSIVAIGGGGGGCASRINIRGGGGGGGGEYRKITNFTPGGATVAYVIGQGGAGGVSPDGASGSDGTDTTFNVTSVVAKKGIGSTGLAGGAGGTGGTGAAANFNGGAGGSGVSGAGNRGGGGGGGAGGTTAVGGTGSAGAAGVGGAGGAGGTVSGGAGGTAGGGAGGAGTVFTANPGGTTSGAGGGGGGGTNLQAGGIGGLYGGGGAGGGGDGSSWESGGNGKAGIIVITYTTA